jgi:hypothetical protein
MHRGLFVLLAGGLALAGGAALGGDQEKVFSGPQVGEKLLPFKVQGVYGSFAGKELDLVTLAGGKPVLFVFVHNATRPAAALTRALVNYGETRTPDGLYPAIIWLTADRSQAEHYLRQATSWWGVNAPVGISPEGAEGPGAYGLNRNVTLTVLIGKDNRVTANFALVQPSVTDAAQILAEVVKLVGGKVPTAVEIEFLRMSTQLPAGLARGGQAPRDPQLRALICAVLAGQEEPGKVEEAAAAVEKYVGGATARQTELGEAAKILTGQPLGAAVKKRLAVWAERFGIREKN